jgi:hypothetical protein
VSGAGYICLYISWFCNLHTKELLLRPFSIVIGFKHTFHTFLGRLSILSGFDLGCLVKVGAQRGSALFRLGWIDIPDDGERATALSSARDPL